MSESIRKAMYDLGAEPLQGSGFEGEASQESPAWIRVDPANPESERVVEYVYPSVKTVNKTGPVAAEPKK